MAKRSFLSRSVAAMRTVGRDLRNRRQYHGLLFPLWRRKIRGAAFICGCGHSGSTLLANMLAGHAGLHVPLFESEAFVGPTRWHVLAQLCNAAEGRVLVEKTPRHICELNRIRQAFPGARFLLMVRDGRNVSASIARRKGGDFEFGLRRWLNDSGIVANQFSQADCLLIRYEDLVSDASGTLRAICEFLGVQYSDGLLDYHRQPRMWFGEETLRKGSGVEGSEHNALRNWQVNQPIFDARDTWKTELPPEIIAAFATGRAGDLMRTFGYSTD